MIFILAGVLGGLGSLLSHDLAAQSLAEKRLRPLAGSCPRCGAIRGWPRTTCPSCGRRVGREWLVVVGGVLGAMGMTAAVGTSWVLLAYIPFVWLTLALALTDLDAMRIVNRLNIPGTVALTLLLAVTAAMDGNLADMGRGLLGALAYFALTNMMFLLARGRAFGYGDVKLSVQLGLFSAYLSWSTLVWSVFFMAAIGGLVSLVIILIGLIGGAAEEGDGEDSRMKKALRREVPYGPSMIGGTWLAIYLVGIGLLGS